MLENVEQRGVHHAIVVQTEGLAGPGLPHGWRHISRGLDPLAGIPQPLAAPPAAEHLTEDLQTVLAAHLLLRGRTLVTCGGGGHQGVGAQVARPSLRSGTGEGLQLAAVAEDGVVVGGAAAAVHVLDQAARQGSGHYVGGVPLRCSALRS